MPFPLKQKESSFSSMHSLAEYSDLFQCCDPSLSPQELRHLYGLNLCTRFIAILHSAGTLTRLHCSFCAAVHCCSNLASSATPQFLCSSKSRTQTMAEVNSPHECFSALKEFWSGHQLSGRDVTDCNGRQLLQSTTQKGREEVSE
jgi:hypothetical protein